MERRIDPDMVHRTQPEAREIAPLHRGAGRFLRLGVGRLLLAFLLAAGIAGFLAGCLGVTQNPSYFPFLLPTGDVIRTHAKPPGIGYFRNFDPKACRLEVRPHESTNPVQTQHVILATIYDSNGKPRRKRRVEWLLEGVGNIVEVDESGYFPGRGYKVDNKYAVSYTDYCEHRITRGNNDPCDDFVVRPGQTWCVISSAIEGDTHVTVYAPEIANWDHHKVFVTKHWVDAQWQLPPPAVNRAGTEHVFTTHIFKYTDHQPLAGYKVRYRIIDGPPAVFLPRREQEHIATTDLNGNASVTLAQLSPRAGINRIAIDIIRPPEGCMATGSGIVIGHGETTKEWVAPVLGIVKVGPPMAPVNTEVSYTITVTNTGKVDVQAPTVRDTIPEGLQYLRSDPPAAAEGNQLTWTLGAMPPGQSRNINVVFKALRVGPVTNCASATTEDNVKVENCTTTQIVAPQLAVTKTGPATGVVNVPINYTITVTNPGDGPLTNVLLSDSFDAGLVHDSGANPVEVRIPRIDAGKSETVPLVLTPKQIGRLNNRVVATADGGLTAKAEHPVDIQKAQLTIKKTGPTMKYLNRTAIWDIRVTNPGDVPLTGVVIRDQLPPELTFVSASDGGQPQGTDVVWNIGTLQPREQRAVALTTKCVQLSPKSLNVAIVTANPAGVNAPPDAPTLRAQDEAAVEIAGLPAFRLEVVDVDDPVEIGSRTQYHIDVTNQGSLPGTNVSIIAIVPPEFRIVNTTGPGQPKIEGQKITFPPIDQVQPGQGLKYTVEVEALKEGDVRFHVELRSLTLGTQPVIEEESTRIVGPTPPGGRPAAPAAPPAAPGAPPAPPEPRPMSSGDGSTPTGTPVMRTTEPPVEPPPIQAR
jgi:uncharacterized repeat protein (TIGR01451 family)